MLFEDVLFENVQDINLFRHVRAIREKKKCLYSQKCIYKNMTVVIKLLNINQNVIA